MQKRSVRKLWFLMAVLIVGTAMIFAFYQMNRSRLREIVVEEQTGGLRLVAQNINNFYAPLEKNIAYLAQLPGVRECLRDRQSATSLAEDFVLIASAVQGYDQIRLLGLDGQEVLRVNRVGDSASVVPENMLQDKSGRDYFQAALKLSQDETYISPVDLNQENGVTEVPYKEVIRCAKQIFDGDAKPLGVVITNYIGTRFLPDQEDAAARGHTMLLTRDGSFIQGPARYPRFATLLNIPPPSRFDDFYPGVWDTIKQHPGKPRLETEAGIFLFQKIRPIRNSRANIDEMFLVSLVPRQVLDSTDLNPWLTTLVIPLTGCWLLGGLLGITTAKRDQQQALAEHQTLIADQLAQRAELLRSSNEELAQFAFVASHDLQEPLRKISTFGELLEDDFGDTLPPEGLGYLRVIVDASNRMRELIRDLLDYSRIDSQARELGPVQSEDAFRQAIANLSASITKSNATITSAAPLPVVIADQHQLTRMFQNLIGNAIKYCKQRPEISVTAKAEGAFWHFTIQDNGLGIPSEYRDTVFQIFKRLHNRSEFEGTGIGLAICRRVIEGCGGKIWIESAPDQGTIFHFTIPTA